ncbi:hypothetical protein RhiirB3_402864 [Rhizophagus irregularis]|nr:hypothetical protein RhiirB3_402864 [Rhizophagus irregularis]
MYESNGKIYCILSKMMLKTLSSIQIGVQCPLYIMRINISFTKKKRLISFLQPEEI